MDAPTRAILEKMRAAGWAVEVNEGPSDPAVTATKGQPGTPEWRQVVYKGPDLYNIAWCAARACGIELEDG